MSTTLTSIYLKERPVLMGRVQRIVRDFQVAEDLTQETYLRTSKALEQAPIDNLAAYLHQTARNLALDHLRRKSVRGRVETSSPLIDEIQISEAQPSNEDLIAGRQRLTQLVAALNGLPRRAQAVMILARIEGWSNRRIAAHLGISERTVFSDLKTALAHCRDALARLDWP